MTDLRLLVAICLIAIVVTVAIAWLASRDETW